MQLTTTSNQNSTHTHIHKGGINLKSTIALCVRQRTKRQLFYEVNLYFNQIKRKVVKWNNQLYSHTHTHSVIVCLCCCYKYIQWVVLCTKAVDNRRKPMSWDNWCYCCWFFLLLTLFSCPDRINTQTPNVIFFYINFMVRQTVATRLTFALTYTHFASIL